MKICEILECQICHKKYNSITNTHLKKHNLTLKQYKEKYPNLRIRKENWMSEEQKEKFSERMKKMRKNKTIKPGPMSKKNNAGLETLIQ